MKEPAKLLSTGAMLLLAAMAVLICAVAICAWAGKRRDMELPASTAAAQRASFGVAVVLCLLAGALWRPFRAEYEHRWSDFWQLGTAFLPTRPWV
jgi:hypothetical protein